MKTRILSTNGIIKRSFFSTSRNHRIQQSEPLRHNDECESSSDDLAKILYNSNLPVMSYDEAMSRLTESEKKLVESLGNGGMYEYEPGDVYRNRHSEYEAPNSSKKTKRWALSKTSVFSYASGSVTPVCPMYFPARSR